jgi:rare lipoprotein A
VDRETPHAVRPRRKRSRKLFIVIALVGLATPGSSLAQALDYAGENLARDKQTRFQTGYATYYATQFEGRRTASGAVFRHDALLAAHPSLPFGTLARVTNLAKGTSVVVRIADRGPAAEPRSRGVIIDLSHQAAKRLNMMRHGRVRVGVQALAAARGTGARQTDSLRDTAQPIVVESLPLRLDGELASMPEPALIATADCGAARCER